MRTQYTHPRCARRAFTLVELVAVIVVLAVLAGVAVPKYFDHTNRAKTSAALGALGGMRTAINTYMLNTAVTGTPQYPTVAQLTTVGTVLPNALPKNPYNSSNAVRSVGTAALAASRSVDGTSGWAYFVDNSTNPPTATLWCNSTTATTILSTTSTSPVAPPNNGSGGAYTAYITANNL
jgi:prepilin-type N-terminal cleavage/methylation domain-containing protein